MLNKWSKHSGNLGAEMALFGTPFLAHKLAHLFQHYLLTFYFRCLSHPHHYLTNKRREPLSAQHIFLHPKVNAVIADLLALSLPKQLWQDLLPLDTDEECLPTCWEQWEPMEPSFNKAWWWESEVCIHYMTCSDRNVDGTVGICLGGGNT